MVFSGRGVFGDVTPIGGALSTLRVDVGLGFGSISSSGVLASGGAESIAHALGAIARARGMVGVGREAGITREALPKSLSEAAEPEFSILLRVTRALGMPFYARRAAGD